MSSVLKGFNEVLLKKIENYLENIIYVRKMNWDYKEEPDFLALLKQ